MIWLIDNYRHKKRKQLEYVVSLRTREQIRTATPLPAPAPQAGASTNFATRVSCCKYIFIRNIMLTHHKLI